MGLCACCFVLVFHFFPPLAARGLFWESLATLDKCPLTSGFQLLLAVGGLSSPFSFSPGWISGPSPCTVFKGPLNDISLLYQLQKHPNHSWRCSLLRAVEGDSDPDRSCMTEALEIREFPIPGYSWNSWERLFFLWHQLEFWRHGKRDGASFGVTRTLLLALGAWLLLLNF